MCLQDAFALLRYSSSSSHTTAAKGAGPRQLRDRIRNMTTPLVHDRNYGYAQTRKVQSLGHRRPAPPVPSTKPPGESAMEPFNGRRALQEALCLMRSHDDAQGAYSYANRENVQSIFSGPMSLRVLACWSRPCQLPTCGVWLIL